MLFDECANGCCNSANRKKYSYSGDSDTGKYLLAPLPNPDNTDRKILAIVHFQRENETDVKLPTTLPIIIACAITYSMFHNIMKLWKKDQKKDM